LPKVQPLGSWSKLGLDKATPTFKVDTPGPSDSGLSQKLSVFPNRPYWAQPNRTCLPSDHLWAQSSTIRISRSSVLGPVKIYSISIRPTLGPVNVLSLTKPSPLGPVNASATFQMTSLGSVKYDASSKQSPLGPVKRAPLSKYPPLGPAQRPNNIQGYAHWAQPGTPLLPNQPLLGPWSTCSQHPSTKRHGLSQNSRHLHTVPTGPMTMHRSFIRPEHVMGLDQEANLSQLQIVRPN